MGRLQPAIRSGGDYGDEHFKGLRQSAGEIEGAEFLDCTFSDCSFTESIFRGCRFIRCAFQECDLSLVRVPGSVFSAARFVDCKLIGLDWTQADWSGVRLGEPLAFLDCALSHGTFIGLNLSGMQIKGCVAADVDFRGADLSRADFEGTDLAASLFSNTNLSDADLSGARNYHIVPGENMLKKAKFSLPEAMSLLYSMEIVLVNDS